MIALVSFLGVDFWESFLLFYLWAWTLRAVAGDKSGNFKFKTQWNIIHSEIVLNALALRVHDLLS